MSIWWSHIPLSLLKLRINWTACMPGTKISSRKAKMSSDGTNATELIQELQQLWVRVNRQPKIALHNHVYSQQNGSLYNFRHMRYVTHDLTCFRRDNWCSPRRSGDYIWLVFDFPRWTSLNVEAWNDGSEDPILSQPIFLHIFYDFGGFLSSSPEDEQRGKHSYVMGSVRESHSASTFQGYAKMQSN